jgi:hypothetical protein
MRSSRRCIAIAATTVAVAVAAVPASAQAMVISRGPVPSSRPVRAVVDHSAHAVTRPAARSATSPTGFRWDDAGLGAAGMLVILGSTSLATRRLRNHRPVIG